MSLYTDTRDKINIVLKEVLSDAIRDFRKQIAEKDREIILLKRNLTYIQHQCDELADTYTNMANDLANTQELNIRLKERIEELTKEI